MEKVLVLMSTYNGEKYIREQIDSILAQKGVSVDLLVRDDGSSDKTQAILEEYQSRGLLSWYSGDNIKPARSFMDLVMKASKADYYAFSDQDDYWLPGKMGRAINKISRESKGKPALYCSSTTLVDKDLNPLDMERKKKKELSFKQSLIECGGAGCTMCFNEALAAYLRKPHKDNLLMHDNWVYKVCKAIDGFIIVDDDSYILYRQHENNTIGSLNRHWLHRHLDAIKKEKCYRSQGLEALLSAYLYDMQEQNISIIEKLVNYKRGFNRWSIAFDKGYQTGNKKNDMLFKIAILFGLF